MTRRLAAYGALALVVAAVSAGATSQQTSRDLNRHAWQQQLDTDRAVIDADMVSARAATHNGDQPAKFLAYCATDVTAYNTDATAAGNDLPDGYDRHLTTTDECKATP